jgi:hypothetical protein
MMHKFGLGAVKSYDENCFIVKLNTAPLLKL